MLFNSLAYMLFLPIVVALFWLCPLKFRTPFLLLASYVFYMFWNPVYIFLIVGLTAVNYYFGLALADKKENRKQLFWLGIIANLVVLGFFKYAFFAHDTLNDVLKVFGQPQVAPIPFNIILPLGISFFVFEFIHYLTDVYRGHAPVKSFMEFALFPSFFPTQIAGPIKRYQDFVPQLKGTKLTMKDFNEGFELIIFGLFKKVCLADTIAVFVNRCYAHPDLLNGVDLWIATILFAFQLYFDFSGYTDVARGSALLMGFKVPVNFQLPYIAATITEAFQRWHISLTTWLRDYLFTPLGGARKSIVRSSFNTFVTMSLAGLWHGSAMHFVFWGMFMGMLLILHRVWKQYTRKWKKQKANPVFNAFSIALTFTTVCLSLVFFRSPDLNTAATVFSKLFFINAASEGWSAIQPSVLNTRDNMTFMIAPLLIVAFFICQFFCEKYFSKETPGIVPSPKYLPVFKPVYLAALMILLLIFSPDVTPSYIYFQF